MERLRNVRKSMMMMDNQYEEGARVKEIKRRKRNQQVFRIEIFILRVTYHGMGLFIYRRFFIISFTIIKMKNERIFRALR